MSFSALGNWGHWILFHDPWMETISILFPFGGLKGNWFISHFAIRSFRILWNGLIPQRPEVGGREAKMT